MFRTVEFGGIKSPSKKQTVGICSVFSQQIFKKPWPSERRIGNLIMACTVDDTTSKHEARMVCSDYKISYLKFSFLNNWFKCRKCSIKYAQPLAVMSLFLFEGRRATNHKILQNCLLTVDHSIMGKWSSLSSLTWDIKRCMSCFLEILFIKRPEYWTALRLLFFFPLLKARGTFSSFFKSLSHKLS